MDDQSAYELKDAVDGLKYQIGVQNEQLESLRTTQMDLMTTIKILISALEANSQELLELRQQLEKPKA